jgi:hypothetical protein
MGLLSNKGLKQKWLGVDKMPNALKGVIASNKD